MIDDKTIKSLYDDKPTLLEWLKRVEEWLKTVDAEVKAIDAKVSADPFEKKELNVLNHALINTLDVTTLKFNGTKHENLSGISPSLYKHVIALHATFGAKDRLVYLVILSPDNKACTSLAEAISLISADNSLNALNYPMVLLTYDFGLILGKVTDSASMAGIVLSEGNKIIDSFSFAEDKVFDFAFNNEE